VRNGCVLSSKRRSVRRAGAFTLVELLVVVAILALLISILMPSLRRTMEFARRVVCKTNLKSMGTAWRQYFHEYDDMPGSMETEHDPAAWGDTLSQWNCTIFRAHWSVGNGGYYCNAGRLWKTKLLQGEMVYVCPSMAIPSGGWFNKRKWGWQYCCPRAWNAWLVNVWPPKPGKFSYMTYGRRRMNYYDSPRFAALPGGDKSDDHLQLSTSGVGLDAVPRPASFSWMADNFTTPETALASHVPGINVLYLDGHVEGFDDEKGQVLYDNGLPNWQWLVSGPILEARRAGQRLAGGVSPRNSWS